MGKNHSKKKERTELQKWKSAIRKVENENAKKEAALKVQEKARNKSEDS